MGAAFDFDQPEHATPNMPAPIPAAMPAEVAALPVATQESIGNVTAEPEFALDDGFTTDFATFGVEAPKVAPMAESAAITMPAETNVDSTSWAGFDFDDTAAAPGATEGAPE